uniref:Uncharacterized protein n=1 Tax=Panagrellus redivivus TaxID=6233 RepID=A0A7E4W5W3_PANRE
MGKEKRHEAGEDHRPPAVVVGDVCSGSFLPRAEGPESGDWMDHVVAHLRCPWTSSIWCASGGWRGRGLMAFIREEGERLVRGQGRGEEGQRIECL